jgi:hypothetical protein
MGKKLTILHQKITFFENFKKIYKGDHDKPNLNLVLFGGDIKCQNLFGIGQMEIGRYIQRRQK